MFPVFVDLSGKSILVVGAGRIALRRIRTLLKFGPGKMTVTAPRAESEVEILALRGEILWNRRNYEPEDLEGQDMVLAATDDGELNAVISAACRERGIFVNVSSNRELCDFHFPGIVVSEEITVGINASGINHKKARQVRLDIEEALERERE